MQDITRSVAHDVNSGVFYRRSLQGPSAWKHSQRPTAVCCASRRELFQGALFITSEALLLTSIAGPLQAAETNPELQEKLKKYIRKKKYDPLETYIPPILLAREQLLEAGAIMGTNATGARDLLRSGVFKSLRDDIRAVGEYVVEGSQVDKATSVELVSTFFKSLEAFDFQLLQASRQGKLADDAQQTLYAAVGNLDRILAVVPEDIVSQAQKVVELSSQDFLPEVASGPSAKEAERLEKLLKSL